MNSQDVIRETYDSGNNALKVNVVAGTLTSAGQATVNINGSATIFAVVNTGAVGDPKSFIGLTTAVIGSSPTIFAVVNTTASGGGNVTLDPGSQTQIIGNLTLSDPKGYIGLVSVSHAAWSDPKTYIGLTTSTIGSAPTLYAVVNTTASSSGNVTLDAGSKTQIVGNVTISDSKSYIGLVSVSGFTSPLPVTGTFYQTTQPVSFGNITITDAKTFIGLTTSVIGSAPTIFAVVNTTASASGNVTLDAGSKTQIVGNLTLSDPKGFIGLVTIGNATLFAVVNTAAVGNTNALATLLSSPNYIGLVTVDIGASHSVDIAVLPATPVGTNFIGLVTVAPHALTAGATWIGLVTASNGLAWADPKTFIGLTTVVQGGGGTKYIGLVTCTNGVGTSFMGLVTVAPHALTVGAAWIGLATVELGAGESFIGLVTAWTRNAGSAKTLTNLPIAISLASNTTIVVPGTNLAVNVTNMILSSDATVRIAIKSGVTYLVGNASLGITLFPGGGFVQSGSPDSPCYIGLASGAFVLEKQDIGSTVARIGGNIVYFTE